MFQWECGTFTSVDSVYKVAFPEPLWSNRKNPEGPQIIGQNYLLKTKGKVVNYLWSDFSPPLFPHSSFHTHSPELMIQKTGLHKLLKSQLPSRPNIKQNIQVCMAQKIFLAQMKNRNVNKGLTKHNQQCPSCVTQFSVAKTLTREADGYPYFAETTWTLAPARWGFITTNCPISQLSSLSA